MARASHQDCTRGDAGRCRSWPTNPFGGFWQIIGRNRPLVSAPGSGQFSSSPKVERIVAKLETGQLASGLSRLSSPMAGRRTTAWSPTTSRIVGSDGIYVQGSTRTYTPLRRSSGTSRRRSEASVRAGELSAWRGAGPAIAKAGTSARRPWYLALEAKKLVHATDFERALHCFRAAGQRERTAFCAGEPLHFGHQSDPCRVDELELG
jgi:hypothetical protein